MTKLKPNEIKKDNQNEQAIDPRIDSPDVQVIYPSPVEELTREPMQHGRADNVTEEPPVFHSGEPREQPIEKKEDHVCKVDIQEAVKQNLLGFIVLVVLSLGIGYLIGKK